VGEVRAGEVGAGEFGLDEICAGEVGVGEVGCGEDRSCVTMPVELTGRCDRKFEKLISMSRGRRLVWHRWETCVWSLVRFDHGIKRFSGVRHLRVR
jgi:hypothetical protein